jgi:DNA-binding transcriptional MerR regulator
LLIRETVKLGGKIKVLKKFSISDIENLTGIKAHTIRVWEHRYDFFTPKRSDSNIRYYDDDDLCLFLNIATLNENGYKISKISKMNIEEINQLVKSLKEDHYNVNVQVQMLSNAMLKMDDFEFDEILTACISDMGMEKAMKEIIFPFMRKVGFMWQVGTINAAHEHFATQKIEQIIIYSTYLDAKKPDLDGKRYLLFLPPDENHEIGLLFAQYLIKINGHHALYLGQNLPYDSLEEVVCYYEPDYAFTVLTTISGDQSIEAIINNLAKSVGNTSLILAGGQITINNLTNRDNLIFINNISEFISHINKVSLPIAS